MMIRRMQQNEDRCYFEKLLVLKLDVSQYLLFFQLAEEAGFPPGVINTLPCSRDHVNIVTDAVLKSDLVSKMSFTGSTATGKVDFGSVVVIIIIIIIGIIFIIITFLTIRNLVWLYVTTIIIIMIIVFIIIVIRIYH